MSTRAFFAIVEAHLQAQRRSAAFACAAAAVVGFVQPHGLAGPLFFCSLLGIAIALVGRRERVPDLESCEQSAPLFGRELARARALVPCVIVAFAALAYVLAAEIAGMRELPATLVATVAAAVPSTLTAMSGTVRTGTSLLLYVAMAAGVAAAAFAIVAAGNSLAGELVFSAFVSFLALRQYGETLARYDPV